MSLRRDPVNDLVAAAADLAILNSLSSAEPYLSGAEQTVVRFILDHPDKISTMSAVQLAAAAGVSEATIFRLCRQLELPGYASLRDQVSAAAAHYADSFLKPVSLANPGDAGQGLLQATVYDGIRSLLDALAVGDHEIARAADAIASANRVILSGVGAYTGNIAEMAAFGLQRLGLTCMLWVDAQVSQATAEMFHADDVIIGLSYSGSNKAVAQLMELANGRGATTISLTNYRFSPVARQADISLLTAFRESHIQNFDVLPRLSQLLVVQALIHAVKARLQRAGEEGHRAGGIA